MNLTEMSDEELVAAQDTLGDDEAAQDAFRAILGEMLRRWPVAVLVCPTCGAKEVEDNTLPVNVWVWNIRPNKVGDAKGRWWSQCLVCAAGDPAKGWFVTPPSCQAFTLTLKPAAE